MSKTYFLSPIIFCIIVMISSCAKKEEKSDASDDAAPTSSSSSWCPEVSSCSATPSGSITGVDNGSISGVFSVFHYFGHIGTSGFDNTTDCIDNATYVGSFKSQMGLPTETNSMIVNRAVTSSSSYAERNYIYSDTSCSTEIATVAFGYNLTVGDNVSGLTTSVGDSTYPSTATKVTATQSCVALKASSDEGATWIKTLFSGISIDPAVGTSYQCGISGSSRYALWNYIESSSLSILLEVKSSSAYPSVMCNLNPAIR